VTICQIIDYKDDQDTQDLMARWDFLYEGYVKMDIGNLSLSNPSFTSKSKTIPVTEILDDLVCKTDQLTGDLKDHYNLVAKVHPDFRKYWEGEATYTEEVGKLSLKKRRICRSFDSFFKGNQLRNRLQLNKELVYFRAYHDNHSIPINLERLCRRIHRYGDPVTRAMPGFALMLGMLGYLAGQSVSHPAATTLVTIVMYTLLYGLGGMSSSTERSCELSIFKEIVHDPLVRSAEISDKVINYIK